MVGGGLFPSPPVTKKSPTPTEKSPTVISKRCWTLEYSGELEFSSPFMEQWTLDARGVLNNNTTMYFMRREERILTPCYIIGDGYLQKILIYLKKT